MKNISSAFKRALFYNKRDYIALADITLTNGTVLHLTNDEIWQGGYSREEAISEDENFTVLGSAIINSATIIINNISDKFSEYTFEKATVQLHEAMEFTNETPSRTESLYAGEYTVEDTKYNGATIKLSLVDNMSKFDRPYSESNLSYPATCDAIIRNACSVCGVTLQTFESALKNLSISNPPEKNGITFREVISWVATICGCYAKCDTRGRLELKWIDRTLLQQTLDSIDGGEFDTGTPYYTTGVSLDGGTFNPWNTGDVYDGGDFAELDNIATIKGLSSQDICVDDTVIAGVRILIKDKEASSNQDILSYIYPANYTEGFVVEISDNEFITTDNVQTILTHLGTLLYGMTFRKLNVTQLSDPSIEAGDIGLVIDRKQHAFAIIVTRCTFKIGSRQTIVCGSESALNNSSTRFSQATKTFLETKAMMNVERNERILALQQLSNALNSKSGLYTTVETTASGAIFYMHDLPNLSESKVVWKMTDEAWGVTTNYNGAHPEQTVWNAGMTVDGNTLVRLLSAVGINADWIDAGAFTVRDSHGNVTFSADVSTGAVVINATSFSLQGSTIQQLARQDINVGARNLLLDTSDARQSPAATGNTAYVPVYNISDYGKTYLGKSGQVLTLSFDYEVTGNSDEFALLTPYCNGYELTVDANSRYGQYAEINAIDEPVGTYRQTFDLSSIQASQSTKKIQLVLETCTNGSKLKVWNVKLEVGDVATDWTAAPEDFAEEISDAIFNYDNELDKDKVFNKLTNNGQSQGIYLNQNDGLLYINASYIASGILKLGGANNGRGRLYLYDANENLVGGMNNEEIYHKNTSNDKVSLKEGGLFFYANTTTEIGAIERSGINQEGITMYGKQYLNLMSNNCLSLYTYSNNTVYEGLNMDSSHLNLGFNLSDTYSVSVKNGATEYYVEIPTSIGSNGEVIDYVALRIVGGIVCNRV